MSFLLHTDACSAHVRNVRSVASRFQQHLGSVHVSAVSVAELELWLLHRRTPARYLQGYGTMMGQLVVLNVDDAIAHQAAVLGTALYDQGRRLTTAKLLVAATAWVHGLTLVTHDPNYAGVQGLAVVDWQIP